MEAKPSRYSKKKSRPKAALSRRVLVRSGSERETLIFARPAIRHEADASEAEDHHSPCGGFRDGGGRRKIRAGQSGEERLTYRATQSSEISCCVMDYCASALFRRPLLIPRAG
jgi:hypothetical protein